MWNLWLNKQTNKQTSAKRCDPFLLISHNSGIQEVAYIKLGWPPRYHYDKVACRFRRKEGRKEDENQCNQHVELETPSGLLGWKWSMFTLWWLWGDGFVSYLHFLHDCCFAVVYLLYVCRRRWMKNLWTIQVSGPLTASFGHHRPRAAGYPMVRNRSMGWRTRHGCWHVEVVVPVLPFVFPLLLGGLIGLQSDGIPFSYQLRGAKGDSQQPSHTWLHTNQSHETREG